MASANGQPQNPPPPPSPPPSPVGFPNYPTRNVHLEVLVTETIGCATCDSHTEIGRDVDMTVANGRMGSVRSGASVNDVEGLRGLWPLDIDATALEVEDGKILLDLSVEMTLPKRPDLDGSGLDRLTIQDSLTVVLADGEPRVVVVSTDLGSDRTVTVTATATMTE